MSMPNPYKVLINQPLTTVASATAYTNTGVDKILHVKSVTFTNTTSDPIVVTGYSHGITSTEERFSIIVPPKPVADMAVTKSSSNFEVIEDFAILAQNEAISFKASAIGVNCIAMAFEEDLTKY